MGLRRRTSTSIHAAAPRRRLNRRLVAGLAAAVVAAGGVTFAVLHTGSAGNAAGSDLAQAGAKPGTYVDVLIDGWTAKTLASAHLRYSVDNKATAALHLRPVTDDDVAELLKTTPEIVTNTLARLATVDTGLHCAAAGCTDGTGAVDGRWLVHPGDIPDYGTSYDGYGITSGLYTARIPTAGAGQVQLAADGYDTFLISPQAQTDNGKPAAPDIFNGYNRGRFLVAAGLGRFFQPRPAWLGAHGTGNEVQRYQTVAPATPGNVADLDPTSPVVFLQGLAPAYPQAARFGDTHLMYLTSPTTGCGVGVVCVPGTVSPTILTQNRTASYVCDGGGTHVAVAVLDDVHIRVKLPAATHQAGVWGGKLPADFDGAGKGAGMFTGRPPLAEGTMEVRWAAVGFFDDDPLTLRVLAGRTDSGPGADLTTPASLTDLLGKVRLDGAFVTACS